MAPAHGRRVEGEDGVTRLQGWIAGLAAAGLVLTWAVPTSAGANPTARPSLRLLAARSAVTITRSRHYAVLLDLGVFVTPVGAPLQLDVFRPDYDSPLQIDQVSDGGASVTPMPADLLDGYQGLVRFGHIKVVDANGDTVSHGTIDLCPASYDRARVDDTGPPNPTYPAFGCQANPFTLGTVWGIDQGWAVNLVSPYEGPGDGGTRFAGPDGTYRVVFRIDDAMVDAFAIAPADATSTVTLHLRTQRQRCSSCTPRVPHLSPGSSSLDGATGASPDVPIVSDPEPSTLPDLIPLPSSTMFVTHRRNSGRDELVFGATVWNRGPASLWVEGFRQPDASTMDAWQYFTDPTGTIVGKASVGSFEYDARRGHEHWHFEQFARYLLLDGAKQRIVKSHKEAFCLAPTDAIDLLAPRAEWNPGPLGFGGPVCGSENSIWTREVLPTGWGDTYYQFLPGQSFDITDLPNGRYYVEVQANPKGELFESDLTNDLSYRRIFLRGTPGHRFVVVPPWHGLDG
jgi:Lysyl oxidase